MNSPDPSVFTKVYGPAIYFAGVLLPPILAGASALALLWALLWAEQSENRWCFVWPGALMGLTFHLAPYVVLFTPVVVWWLWRNGSRAECLAFAAGAVCVTAPSLFVPAIGFERFFAFDLIYGMAHGREYTAALDMYETRDVSSVLAILVWEWGIAFPFGLLLPLALLGGASGQIKPGGRHLLLSEKTPITNLHLTILDKMGVPVEKMSDSTGRLDLLTVG